MVFTKCKLVKICQNCQARHGYIDWRTGIIVSPDYIYAITTACIGVFNVSNKIIVSLDILFEMREHIRNGEPPGNITSAFLTAALLQPSAPLLTEHEVRYLNEKLYDGYFAFEVLTKRNWDSAICGICGVSPIFESGDGNVKNCTSISKDKVNTCLLLYTLNNGHFVYYR